MRSWNRLKITICFTLCASLLSACSFQHVNLSRASDTKSRSDITSLGLSPEFSYDVPVSSPSIEADRLGYLIGEKKKAVFKSNKPGDDFSLVNAQTGKTVYKGKLRKLKSAEGESCIGDFSSWDKPGRYYLENEKTGRSYTFEISEDLYGSLLNTSLKQYYLSRCGMSLTEAYAGKNAHGACHMKSAYIEGESSASLNAPVGWHVDGQGDRDVIQGCQASDILLLTYELNPNVCGDDEDIPESGNGIPDILDEIRYETDWLLKMQDEKSGGVYNGINVTGAVNAQTLVAGKITMNATLEFAAAMAKFSYVYQTFDSEYATLCLKAADRAMQCAAQHDNDTDPDDYFMAASELYRATGYAKYGSIVTDYLTENEKPDISDKSVFRGCVTYICTKQKVDTDICSRIITELMDEASELSENARHKEYLVTTYDGDDNIEKMLEMTSHLAVVNYVISNSEYRTALGDYVHYFFGRNNGAVIYAHCGVSEDAGSKGYDINSKTDLNAYWVLLISGLENAGTGDDK